MRIQSQSLRQSLIAIILGACLAPFSCTSAAGQTSFTANDLGAFKITAFDPTSSGESAIEVLPAMASVPAPHAGDLHKFWDKENTVLFSLNGALSAVDFAVTRANVQGGGQEYNPVTRMFGNSTGGLAINFAGESAAVVAVSYMLHKTGHHKLERAVSIVNISSSASAVSYDFAHR